MVEGRHEPMTGEEVAADLELADKVGEISKSAPVISASKWIRAIREVARLRARLENGRQWLSNAKRDEVLAVQSIEFMEGEILEAFGFYQGEEK